MLKGVWCKCCIHGDHFVRVARVPGKPGSPGKTGFLKILPGKPWKQYTFQDDVPGKPGKKIFGNKSSEIYFIYSCMYVFVQPIIQLWDEKWLTPINQIINEILMTHNRIPA